MGREQRFTEQTHEMHLRTLRRITITARDGQVFEFDGRGVQNDTRVVIFKTADEAEHVFVLMPGDHVSTLPLDAPSVIEVGRPALVVPS